MNNEVLIPNPVDFRPYEWQKAIYNAPAQGYDRIVEVIHRRAGKDIVNVNYIAGAMYRRVGGYYYCFPTRVDGKDIIWDGHTDDGRPYLSFFPKKYFPYQNETELSIEATNGSFFKILGTDKKINVGRGKNPVFVVFSECAYQNPYAIEVFNPILLKNKGVAVYQSTPNGKNFFYQMYKTAQELEKQPGSGWKTFLKTINDTYDHQGDRLITDEMVQRERDRGVAEEIIQQEYYCSFEASHPGAYYAVEMRRALEGNRIITFTIDRILPVYTFWDLGSGGEDAMSIWFVQFAGNEAHLIDFISDSGQGIEYYVNKLKEWQNQKGIVWGQHVLPHDGNAFRIGIGTNIKNQLKGFGFDTCVIERPQDKGLAIESGRQILSRCWFNSVNCAHGIEGLRQYRREKDEKNSIPGHPVYHTTPVHDWSSHIADAFQTFAQWTLRNCRIELEKSRQSYILTRNPDDLGNTKYNQWGL